MFHNTQDKSLTIQIDHITEAQSLAIQDMLAQWVSLGRAGSSRVVGFYADGDGNFQPQIEVNSTDCFLPPQLFGTPEEVKARWQGDTYIIDFDEIAWKLRKMEEDENDRRQTEFALGDLDNNKHSIKIGD